MRGRECGLAAFIDFIAGCLIPAIEQRFPADPARRLLLGHSLAGYFALELAAECGDLFGGYASFSPSIWWDRDGLAQRLGTSGQNATASRFYLAAGRYEQENPPWQTPETANEAYLAVRKARRMVGNASDLAGRLAGSLDDQERVRFEIGKQEDHATVFPSLLCRALRFLSAKSKSGLALTAGVDDHLV